MHRLVTPQASSDDLALAARGLFAAGRRDLLEGVLVALRNQDPERADALERELSSSSSR